MRNAPIWPAAGFGRSPVLRAGLGCFLAAAVLCGPSKVHAGPAGASQASVESQILALEKDANDAYAHNDLPRYFSHYAEDFRGLFPEGVTSKAAYVKSWTAYIGGGSKIVDFSWSDMAVNASPAGDAAVVSYHAVATIKEPGKPQSAEKYDETDVWFKRNGKFQLVEVQYSDTGHAP
jgi:ketosteroid isomerase-like protein